MAIIGNPIISTDFPKDTFSGNGSTTAFTMQIAPASVNAVIVVVSGITQDPSTYTISGTTLTFSAAPPTGTSNISIRHLGVAGTPNVPSAASVVTASIADSNVTTAKIADANITPAKLSTGGPSWDSSGNITFNSGYGSVATAYGCRAWVNFNGTGTVAIRSSGNVSSITDNGTGLYTANFTNSMPDANYTSVVGANVNSSNNDIRRNCRVITWSSSSTSVVTGNNAGSDSKEDYEFVSISVFR